MKQLQAIENSTNGTMLEQHILDIPVCCPVSKNPRSGSTITISYYPVGQSLEVASLIALVHSFKGGLYSDEGELLVRDMEGMIQHIAEECARVLAVPVTVEADLQILPRQRMKLTHKSS